jgi:hypothetical protein
MVKNNVTNYKYFTRKSTRKVAEDPNYEYWRRVERAERLGKQFEKEHNMCCFTLVIGLIGCFCLPCIVCNRIYPEKNQTSEL